MNGVGTDPTTPRRQRPVRWRVMLLVGLGVAGLGTYQVYGLLVSLTNARTERQRLAQANEELRARLHTREEEQAKLQADQHALTVDRDNLLLQTQRLLEERDRAVAVRDLLQTLFKRSAQEARSLKGQLLSGQPELTTLREERANLEKQVEALQRQLAKTDKRSREKALEAQVAKERQRAAESMKTLRTAHRQAKRFERTKRDLQAKLTRLEQRLATLQDRYASLMATNTALARQVKKIPKDVTRLAQQHERLIKETAQMHYNLGVLFAENKQYAEAVVEFKKVIELRPDDADAHYNLGAIYAEHLPHREKAMAYFRRYLRINPGAHDASWVKQYIASWQAWEAKERLE